MLILTACYITSKDFLVRYHSPVIFSFLQGIFMTSLDEVDRLMHIYILFILLRIIKSNSGGFLVFFGTEVFFYFFNYFFGCITNSISWVTRVWGEKVLCLLSPTQGSFSTRICEICLIGHSRATNQDFARKLVHFCVTVTVAVTSDSFLISCIFLFGCWIRLVSFFLQFFPGPFIFFH